LRFASGRVLRSVAQVPGLPPTGPFRPRLGILVFAFFSFRQSLDQPPAKRPSPALRTFCCFQLRCRFQLRNLWLSACPVTWAWVPDQPPTGPPAVWKLSKNEA